jgi:hypothetical protein
MDAFLKECSEFEEFRGARWTTGIASSYFFVSGAIIWLITVVMLLTLLLPPLDAAGLQKSATLIAKYLAIKIFFVSGAQCIRLTWSL